MLRFVALCLAAACQGWVVGILLMTRQDAALLFFSLLAGIFWSWRLWSSFLRNWRAGVFLAGCCLSATLALGVVVLLAFRTVPPCR